MVGWLLKKLADCVDTICNIWSSKCEVLEAANNKSKLRYSSRVQKISIISFKKLDIRLKRSKKEVEDNYSIQPYE
jgi:hypothetical protein